LKRTEFQRAIFERFMTKDLIEEKKWNGWKNHETQDGGYRRTTGEA
jgi:hypothetical protein